jgi:hypothetical protein
MLDKVRTKTATENSTQVEDTDIINFLNEGLAELDDILVEKFDDYKLTSFQSVIQPGGNIFPTPSDCLKIREVEVAFAQRWITVKRFNLQQKNKWNYPILRYPYGNLCLEYRQEGRFIEIIPAASAVGTYQVWYIPEYQNLVNPTDTLPDYMNKQAWYEVAIMHACLQVATRLDTNPADYAQQKLALIARIQNAAASRDAGSVKKAINTRQMNKVGNGWGRGGGFF